MKIKKPSVKGMKNVGYLGRFQKDKFIQDGHNTGPKTPRDVLMNKDESTGGGGGGGSPRGAKGRPSGARNIDLPAETDIQAAEGNLMRAELAYNVRSRDKTPFSSKVEEVLALGRKASDARWDAMPRNFDPKTGKRRK